MSYCQSRAFIFIAGYLSFLSIFWFKWTLPPKLALIYYSRNFECFFRPKGNIWTRIVPKLTLAKRQKIRLAMSKTCFGPVNGVSGENNVVCYNVTTSTRGAKDLIAPVLCCWFFFGCCCCFLFFFVGFFFFGGGGCCYFSFFLCVCICLFYCLNL